MTAKRSNEEHGAAENNEEASDRRLRRRCAQSGGSYRRQLVIILFVLFIIVLILGTAVIIWTKTGWLGKESHSTNSQPLTPKSAYAAVTSAPTLKPTPPPLPQRVEVALRKSSAPASQQTMSTSIPSPPSPPPSSINNGTNQSLPYFLSTEELYEAVDAYWPFPSNASAARKQQIIDQYGTMSEWDVSRISDFSHLFDPYRNSSSGWCVGPRNYDPWYNDEHDDVYIIDVSGWDTSAVTNMSGAFRCTKIHRGRDAVFRITGVEAWDMSHVTDMSFLFLNSNILLNITTWNVSSLIQMASMFQGYDRDAITVDQSQEALQLLNVSAWDVGSVVDMTCLFCRGNYFQVSRERQQMLRNWNNEAPVSPHNVVDYLYEQPFL